MHHAILCIDPDLNQDTFSVLPEHIDCEQQLLWMETFTIDDARRVIAAAHTRPTDGEQQVFVLAARTFPHEAQNALLKILEEPPESSLFYLVVPSAAQLLPTVRSRLHEIRQGEGKSETSDDVVTFMHSSVADRLVEIAVRMKNKDYAWGESVISAVADNGERDRELLLLVEQYYKRRGASRKMLLEAIALSTPIA